ncbi:DUF5108 domain-containing protein [Prolixibacteraceae bacterium JC049]|nr:DUF5108 domain-containing protein [Prolixibacteraceae bacterium JC049]
MKMLQKFKARLLQIAAILFVAQLWFGCEQSIDQNFSINETLSISHYLDSRPDDFSMWTEALNESGLYNSFNVYGTFTAFIPDNKAMSELLKLKGKSKVSELGKEYLTTLIKYHTLNKTFKHTDFSTGFLPDTTFTGDRLTSIYGDDGINSIYINKEALITEKDIEVTNGVVHRLNKVLYVVTESIYDIIKADPSLTIFTEAIEKTGWKDFLSTISNKEEEQYTLLCLSNDVLKAENINSFADLAQKYSKTDDYTNTENKLNQFVAYHILHGNSSYSDLLNFRTDKRLVNIPTLSALNFVSVGDYNSTLYFNYDEEKNQKYGLILDKSNVIAKNGVIHFIDGLMPVYVPKPAEFAWIFSKDIPVIKTIETYRNGTGDSKESLSHLKIDRIKWQVRPITGEAGLYYEQRFNLTKNDGMSPILSEVNPSDFIRFMTNGKAGWIEFKTPAVVKGKYKVHIGFASSPYRAAMQSFLDGVKGNVVDNNKGWPAQIMDRLVGTYEFEKTQEHTIRLVYIKGMWAQIHHIRFEPVVETAE